MVATPVRRVNYSPTFEIFILCSKMLSKYIKCHLCDLEVFIIDIRCKSAFF